MAVLVDLIVAALKMIAAMVLSAGAIYSGTSLLDRLTQGLEEWKEIRKGNLAVALLYSAVMLSIVLLVAQRIGDIVFYIQADLPLMTTVVLLLMMGINYLLGLLVAVAIVFITINLIDKITPDLEELSELKKGNVAVALLISVALIMIVLSVTQPLELIFTIIKSLESTIL